MQKSCKHAVKGGDVLSETEIEYLLGQLLEKDTLLSCPHGRPIFVRITQKELEKMFKRIPE
jgi:DNA mismatch repair protein MutL